MLLLRPALTVSRASIHSGLSASLHSNKLATLHLRAMSSGKDQYTAASGVDVSFSEKLADFQTFMKKHGLVMLTTRGPSGALHSRCMAPANTTSDLKMQFIYDRDSYKDTEVENEWVFSCHIHLERLHIDEPIAIR